MSTMLAVTEATPSCLVPVRWGIVKQTGKDTCFRKPPWQCCKLGGPHPTACQTGHLSILQIKFHWLTFHIFYGRINTKDSVVLVVWGSHCLPFTGKAGQFVSGLTCSAITDWRAMSHLCLHIINSLTCLSLHKWVLFCMKARTQTISHLTGNIPRTIWRFLW